MADDPKAAQLRELLKKSLKYIVANLEVMEKEVFIAAAKGQHEQFKTITKAIMDVATLLENFPESGAEYTAREFPDALLQRVTAQQLAALKKIDVLLFEITSKLDVVSKRVNSPGPLDKNLAVRITATNQVVKNYVSSLTTSVQAAN